MIDVVVADELRGARLDRFLASVEAIGSRTLAERLLAEGKVTVDGEQRHKAFRVLPGMHVLVDAEPVVQRTLAFDASVPFRIAYEDASLIVVDKPAGVVVHPAPGQHDATLVHGLLDEGITGGDDEDRPGIVHRLDKDTSGLLVVAKTEEAWRELGRQMRRREITREYVALVHGRPSARAGRIEAPIGRDRGKGRMAVDGTGAKPAITHFEVAELLPATTLLTVTLGTGRTHQIRVHLEAIGHPVVGDPQYCPAASERYGLQRQFLHAARLVFEHPLTGEEIATESPLPADLVAALERARVG
jgi:23S rRNA pseudouridine1911/1915/1917 synthase